MRSSRTFAPFRHLDNMLAIGMRHRDLVNERQLTLTFAGDVPSAAYPILYTFVFRVGTFLNRPCVHMVYKVRGVTNASQKSNAPSVRKVKIKCLDFSGSRIMSPNRFVNLDYYSL
jgi:hypothetical protein